MSQIGANQVYILKSAPASARIETQSLPSNGFNLICLYFAMPHPTIPDHTTFLKQDSQTYLTSARSRLRVDSASDVTTLIDLHLVVI